MYKKFVQIIRIIKAVCHPKNIIKNILILLNNISVLFSLFEIIQIIQIICKLLQIIRGGFSWCICYST